MKKHKLTTVIAVLALVGMLGFAGTAQASGLTISADTTLALTSPAINLTLVSGSTATSVQVNAGTVAVTVGSGDSFTITSASRSITLSGDTAGGGTKSTTCSSGVDTGVFTAAATQTITVTPGSAACTTTVVPTAGGSGGGGPTTAAPVVTTPTPTPTPIPTTPSALQLVAIPAVPANPTTAQVQTVITAVLNNINYLKAQLAILVAQESPVAAPSSAVPLAGSFTMGLTTGTRGDDVKSLQIFLNQSEDTKVASSGVGSPGNETSYFGPLTSTAVGKFQLKYEVVADETDPGFGYVGPKTRAKINELLGL